MTFERQLRFGKVAEGLIAKWLRSRGHAVMPVYEIEKSSGKGPQLFAANKSFAAPDLVAFTSAGVIWIEAKHKTVFTWHRISGQWTTGIDLNHYEDYLNVRSISLLPVWLLFFHRGGSPSDADAARGAPMHCPSGLFGGDIDRLIHCENHRSLPFDSSRNGFKGHGRSGMVYWAHADLQRLATLAEILDIAGRGAEK